MAIKDCKITDAGMNENGMVAAPDTLKGSAQENKAMFDRLVRQVVADSLNRLIDALTAETGASEIGMKQFEGVDAKTVQEGMELVLQSLSDLRRAEEETKQAAEEAAYFASIAKDVSGGEFVTDTELRAACEDTADGITAKKVAGNEGFLDLMRIGGTLESTGLLQEKATTKALSAKIKGSAVAFTVCTETDSVCLTDMPCANATVLLICPQEEESCIGIAMDRDTGKLYNYCDSKGWVQVLRAGEAVCVNLRIIGMPETAVTVSSQDGKYTMQDIIGEGMEVNISLPVFGVMQIFCQLNGESFGTELEIQGSENVTIAQAPALEHCSWSLIEKISDLGLASKTWNVGEQKNIKISGTEYPVQIIGFDHDTLADGSGTAGMTFMFAKCYKTSRMYASNSNAAGWPGSIGASEAKSLYKASYFPAELKSVIKTVEKTTSVGGGSTELEKTQDTLFMLSAAEVFSNYQNHAADGEGRLYAYFSEAEERGRGSTTGFWWLRSPSIYVGGVANGKNAYCYVNEEKNQLGSCRAYVSAHGNAFGFCV